MKKIRIHLPLISISVFLGLLQSPAFANTDIHTVKQPKTTFTQILEAPVEIWEEGTGYAIYGIQYSLGDGTATVQDLPDGVTQVFEEGFCDEEITASCNLKLQILGEDMTGDIDGEGPELCMDNVCSQPIPSERLTVSLTDEPGTLSVSPSSTEIVVGSQDLTWTLTNTSTQALYQVQTDFGSIANDMVIDNTECDYLAPEGRPGDSCTITGQIDARVEDDASNIYFAAANSEPAKDEIFVDSEGILIASTLIVKNPAHHVVMLTNTSATRTLKKIEVLGIEGDIEGVELLSSKSCGTTLPPKGTCSLLLMAHPDAQGAGKLMISYEAPLPSNKLDKPQQLIAAAQIGVLKTELEFDVPEIIIVGREAQPKAIFQVKNLGEFAATGFHAKALGDEVQVTDNCPRNIEAGRACTVSVSLKEKGVQAKKDIATNYVELSADNASARRYPVMLDGRVNIVAGDPLFSEEEFSVVNLQRQDVEVQAKVSRSLKDVVEIVTADQNKTEISELIVIPGQGSVSVRAAAKFPVAPQLDAQSGEIMFEVSNAAGNDTEQALARKKVAIFSAEYQATIVATGDFNSSSDSQVQAPGNELGSVAIYAPVQERWRALPELIGTGNDLLVANGQLHVAGAQANAGLQASTEYLAVYDGESFKAAAENGVLDGPVNVLTLDAPAPGSQAEPVDILLGGAFNKIVTESGINPAQAVSALKLARMTDGMLEPLDDMADSGVDDGIYQTEVNALAVHDTLGDKALKSLAVGGGFTEAFDGTKQSLKLSNLTITPRTVLVFRSPGGGVDNNVNGIVAVEDGNLLVLGEFQTAYTAGQNTQADDEIIAFYAAVWDEEAEEYFSPFALDAAAASVTPNLLIDEFNNTESKAEPSYCVTGEFTQAEYSDGRVVTLNGVGLLRADYTFEPLGNGLIDGATPGYVVNDCICDEQTCYASGAFAIDGEVANIAQFDLTRKDAQWSALGYLLKDDSANPHNTGVVNAVLPVQIVEAQLLPKPKVAP
jgi:hypothetical protein